MLFIFFTVEDVLSMKGSCYTNVIKDVDDELDDDCNTNGITTHHKSNAFPLWTGSFYIYVPLTQTTPTK